MLMSEATFLFDPVVLATLLFGTFLMVNLAILGIIARETGRARTRAREARKAAQEADKLRENCANMLQAQSHDFFAMLTSMQEGFAQVENVVSSLMALPKTSKKWNRKLGVVEERVRQARFGIELMRSEHIIRSGAVDELFAAANILRSHGSWRHAALIRSRASDETLPQYIRSNLTSIADDLEALKSIAGFDEQARQDFHTTPPRPWTGREPKMDA